MTVIVTIKLISVQFQLKLPAKTELGNKYILSRVGAGAAYACYSDNKANLSSISVEMPAKTELGNKYILSRVGAGAACACNSDNKANLSSISVEKPAKTELGNKYILPGWCRCSLCL